MKPHHTLWNAGPCILWRTWRLEGLGLMKRAVSVTWFSTKNDYRAVSMLADNSATCGVDRHGYQGTTRPTQHELMRRLN